MRKQILLGIACLISSYAFAQKTFIHAGRLIDVKEMRVLTEQTIIVEDGKITSVTKGYQSPGSSDQAIDLKNATVLPGLMDMHVRFCLIEAEEIVSTMINKILMYYYLKKYL